MTILAAIVTQLSGQDAGQETILPLLVEAGDYLGPVLIYLFWTAVLAGEVYLIHFLFSLPLRRTERARLFLELVAGGLDRGQTVENTILSVAQIRDPMPGVRFHMVAARIEGGSTFGDALQTERRFLPPQLQQILLAGEQLGDLRAVLPACHETLRERPAAVRSAMNYLIMVILFFSPVFIGVVLMTMTFVVPRFKDVAAGMGVPLWPLTRFVFSITNGLVLYELILSLLIVCVVLLYIGGPHFAGRFQFRGLPIMDWFAWRIPWKRKRLQRTFSAMLAVLLDGGVPEVEAVRLAGESTANEICRRRARRVMAALENGAKLDQAVRVFDDSGEFHWRLTNAAHAQGGFLPALRGWHEALDAKAFQQEETTAHVVTSGVVILNGILVALVATAMFGLLVAILDGMLDKL